MSLRLSTSMRRVMPLLAGLALLVLSGGAASADPQVNLKSGLWRIGVAMEITPRIDGPASGPIEVDRCVNATDTRNLLMTPPGASCNIEQTRFTKDVLEWTATCQLSGRVSVAKGRMNFNDTRMEGRIVTEAKGMDLHVDTRVAGRYLGACVPIKSQQPAPPPKAQGPGPGGLQRYQAP